MDAQLPKEPNVVIVQNIPFSENSLTSLSSPDYDAIKAQDAIAFLQSDATKKALDMSPPISPRLEKTSQETELELTKTPKMASFLHALEALKGLTNVSKEEIDKLEENIVKYTQAKEQSIEKQHKTNELLSQLSQHLEQLDNKKTEIQQLKKYLDDHEQFLKGTQTNIQTLEVKLNDLLVFVTTYKQQIKDLQSSITRLEEIQELSTQAHVITNKQTESNTQAFVDLSNRVESLRKTNQSLLRRVQIYMTGSVAILMAAIWIWWHARQI